MNTKEAIEFLNNIKNIYGFEECNWNRDIFKITELLQRGEKYEAMWEELLHQVNQIHPLHLNGEDVRRIINDIKQKYFPKPVKKKVTVNIDKLRSELIVMNEKLLKKYFPIKNDEINEFELYEEDFR